MITVPGTTKSFGEGIENTWLLEIDPSELGQGSLQN
jgi:hypothetical protein